MIWSVVILMTSRCIGASSSQHVQARPGHLPRVQGRRQRRRVDEAPARGVDDDDPRPTKPQGITVEHPAGFVGQRRVEGDDVRLAQQLLQRDVAQPEDLRHERAAVRVAGQHLHAEGQGDADHPQPDAPRPDDAEDFCPLRSKPRNVS